MSPILKTLLFPWPAVVRSLFTPFWTGTSASVWRVMIPLSLVVIGVWWLTVPVHELLHALGCVMTGGSVGELTIQPVYGGAVLSKLFPFVTSGGAYAGQLKSFDTGGNDGSYFVTVALPYGLTVLLGLPMLALAARAGNPFWHGIGMVHTVLPIASIGGDFYEMGSIGVTRLLGMRTGSPAAELVRGDDLFLVLSRVREAGLENGTWIVAGALVLGVVFLTATLDLSLLLARAVARESLRKA